MADATALRVAIQLLHMPANVRRVREAPLPPGIEPLLRVAAGDAETIRQACDLTERGERVVVDASRFFIEQIMWHPRADSYRVLGAAPGASAADIKRNMSLLMTWLHPDVGGDKDARSVFVVRVTSAWNDLKTPERRDEYLASLQKAAPGKSDGYRRRRSQSLRMRTAFVGEPRRNVLTRFLSLFFRSPRP